MYPCYAQVFGDFSEVARKSRDTEAFGEFGTVTPLTGGGTSGITGRDVRREVLAVLVRDYGVAWDEARLAGGRVDNPDHAVWVGVRRARVGEQHGQHGDGVAVVHQPHADTHVGATSCPRPDPKRPA